MKLVVDRELCEGHGLCEEAAPSMLHLDDEGILIIDRDEVTADLQDAAAVAVRVCPVAALRIL
jgi:ferredoxin